MENEKITCYDTCYNCGTIITDDSYSIDENGNYICQHCVENHYVYCEDCSALVHEDDATYIQDGGYYVCEHCLDDYTQCEDCGNWYTSDSVNYVEHYGYICEDCYNNGGYYCCDNCGDLYREDDLNYSHRHDCYYCDSCYDEDEEQEDLLYGYHDFSDWHFYKGKNEEKAPYYIGKEIELEPKDYTRIGNVIESMNKYINAVAMSDGSLNSGGCEIVSHPESWLYLQEKKEDYRAFFRDMQEYGYGDNGHTGLHFHVSKPSDDVISRIIVIIESFKEEIKKLSRRNGDFHWSRFLTDRNDNKEDNLKYQSIKYLKDKYIKEDSRRDRYLALNLCNENTIEFRFFNGVNNFEEFWGALEFIHNIMEVALDEKRDINTITWKELIKGDEIEKQAKKQGVLGIDKTAKDTTEIMEKVAKAKEETKEEIKKTLKNFIKYVSREMENKKLELINRNDINEIERQGRDFLDTLTSDLRYLQRLTNLYRDIDDCSLNYTKDSIENIKYNTISRDKYSRYLKQLDKTIKHYESEVNV